MTKFKMQRISRTILEEIAQTKIALNIFKVITEYFGFIKIEHFVHIGTFSNYFISAIKSNLYTFKPLYY